MPFNRTKADLFKKENDTAILDKYSRSIGLHITKLSCVNGFDNYTSERINSINKFDKLKTPEGDLLSEKLTQAGDAAKPIREAFSQALALTDATKTFKTDFNKDLAAANQWLKKEPQPSASHIAAYLQDIQANTKNSLAAQQQSEMDALNNLFNDETFKTNLAPLGINSDNLDEFKTTTIDALKASHQKEREKLNKSIEKDIQQLHNNNLTEIERLKLLEEIYKTKQGRAAILKAAPPAPPPSPDDAGVSLTINGNEGLGIFKGIKIANLEKFNLVDMDMEVDKKTGTVTVSLSKWNNFGLDGKNFADFRDKNLAVLRAQAKAVKAQNHNSITTKIDFTLDRARALELGRQAYEAAIEEGFSEVEFKKNPDDKEEKPTRYINIEINGKVYGPDELFEGQPARLKELRDRAETLREERKEMLTYLEEPQPLSAKQMQAIKKQISDIRAANEPAPRPDDLLSPAPGLGT